MTYQTIKCKNCGNNFVWSDEERALFVQRGLSEPEYCPICRGIIEARNRDANRKKYER